jgi:ligand-binding sensor domain-containing protein
MKAYRTFLIHALLVLLFKIAAAQDQQLKLHRIAPPSLNMDIHAGVQDPEGYMWFAADNGLYRYNGYDYTYYIDDPLNSNSLVSHHIETVMEMDINSMDKSNIRDGFIPIVEINNL